MEVQLVGGQLMQIHHTLKTCHNVHDLGCHCLIFIFPPEVGRILGPELSAWLNGYERVSNGMHKIFQSKYDLHRQ